VTSAGVCNLGCVMLTVVEHHPDSGAAVKVSPRRGSVLIGCWPLAMDIRAMVGVREGVSTQDQTSSFPVEN
jgi:hypothetical protein